MYGRSSWIKNLLNDLMLTGSATHAPKFSDKPKQIYTKKASTYRKVANVWNLGNYCCYHMFSKQKKEIVLRL